MKLKILILSIIISLFAACPAKIFAGIKHNKHIARRAIAHYFCNRERPYHLCDLGRQALNVADCETGGTFNPYAGYGKHEYWGIFQMGSYERQRFGFAFNAWAQTHAAKKYYNLSGWSPWSCNPF